MPRTGEDSIPGSYSPELQMWVIDALDGEVPIIADGALNELMTKTKVNAEQDDEASCTERDDRCNANHILELITKTNVELERDNNGNPKFGLDTRYYSD